MPAINDRETPTSHEALQFLPNVLGWQVALIATPVSRSAGTTMASSNVTVKRIAGGDANRAAIASERWVATRGQVRAMFSAQPNLTEIELDVIPDGVKQDAEHRKTIAEGDAGPLPPTPGASRCSGGRSSKRSTERVVRAGKHGPPSVCDARRI